MMYVILLCSLFSLYLHGGESSESGQQSSGVPNIPYIRFQLEELHKDGEPKTPIDWLAYMLLSGRSDRKPELGFDIKRLALWLSIAHRYSADIRDQVNLSALLEEGGSLKDSLDAPLDPNGYIIKSLKARMNCAEDAIKPKHQSTEAFRQGSGNKNGAIIDSLSGTTYRKYVKYEHDVLSDEYAERSNNYKNELEYLQLNMKLAALGYGLVGGIACAIYSKFTDRSYASTIAAGVVLGSLIGAAKEYKAGYESVQRSKQALDEIEPVYNNWKLFKEEIARRAPSVRDNAILWGRKVLPYDGCVIVDGNPA